MKKTFLIALIFFCYHRMNSQKSVINHAEIREDLNLIINNISKYYIYLNEKKVNLNCIKTSYDKQIKHIKTEEETVLFFEYLLDEFYDNHLTLKTNRLSSFRLFAPIYASIKNDKVLVTNIWQTQISNLNTNIIGAEILAFNGVSINKKIEDFPISCNNKRNSEVREWIVNKVLAGRYNKQRIITLKLTNKKIIDFDLDKVELKKNNNLISSQIINEVGVIRINNSLGNYDLVSEFDKVLKELMKTKAIIIDLRNTLSGGDSYEARGIMSRFISEPKPYQRHTYLEKPKNNPHVERNYLEYVSPRLETYKKPLVILVGRWTGSMGEGLAIGFEGMERGVIIGSEMRRLAGEVFDFRFKHQKYGYKITTTKLFHVNGTIREKYTPTNYIKQTTIEKDEFLIQALKFINKATN